MDEKKENRDMDKIEVIARRIMGWKLNRWDRWFDYEKNVFIDHSEFQPKENLEHAMLIVKRLEEFGYTYSTSGKYVVCFNHVCANGETLAEAITNAAFEIADNSSVAAEWL